MARPIEADQPSPPAPRLSHDALAPVMPSEESREIELTLLRRMTAAAKWRVAHSLWVTARQLTIAGIRSRHPEWSDTAVQAELRAICTRE